MRIYIMSNEGEVLREHISDRYFESFFLDEGYILKEKNDERDYRIRIKAEDKNTNEIHVFKDIELLKNSKNSTYIYKNPPADCDYILLDDRNRNIIFIELKQYKKKGDISKTSLQEKMRASQKWLDHFFFCSHQELKLSDWSSIYICINHKTAGRYSKIDRKPFSTYPVKIYYGEGDMFDFSTLTNPRYRMS